MARINLPLVIGSLLIIFITIITIISLIYTPYDPTIMAIRQQFTAPSSTHILGTDQYGRDLLSRIMVGGQTSLLIAVVSVSTGMLIGTILGAIAGYYRGWLDELLMRAADVMYAFPIFLLALLAMTVYGMGHALVMVVIAIANIPIFMKITRANYMQLREMNYVEAAKSIGASDLCIMAKHILPNSLRPIMVQASANMAAAVLAEASLSYLGVGVQPPLPSWGRMLREAQSFGSMAPWTIIFPGIVIAMTVLGMNLLADGLKIKGEE